MTLNDFLSQVVELVILRNKCKYLKNYGFILKNDDDLQKSDAPPPKKFVLMG